MASQEVGNTEMETGSGAPGSEMEPERSSNPLYNPIDESQNFTRGQLQALGAIQIMNGIIILALGIFLWVMQYESNILRDTFLFTVYTGYPAWGAVFFISSGSLSIAAERKNTRLLMRNSSQMNIASAIIALVGIAFLSANVALNVESLRSCQLLQTPSLCIYMGLLSTGLVSLMLIFTLLELCTSISVSYMWCKANCCQSKAVTQILVGLLCFSFGTIAYSFINISEFEGNIFSSFRAGYPFWGAIFFGISGLLSIICERKTTTYLVQGRLGTNIVSTIAAGTGIFILIINLKASWSYLYGCPEADENDTCFAASFSTEFVAMLLFLTILELCCTVSTIIYGIGDLFKQDMVPEDRVYEDLNIYSPIYSELEENVETRPPADS